MELGQSRKTPAATWLPPSYSAFVSLSTPFIKHGKHHFNYSPDRLLFKAILRFQSDCFYYMELNELVLN